MLCKNCGAEGNPGEFCSKCGSKFENEEPKSLFCKNCGMQRTVGEFCPNCGNRFDSNTSESLSHPNRITEENAEKLYSKFKDIINKKFTLLRDKKPKSQTLRIVIAVILAFFILKGLTPFGAKYTCRKCDKSTSKAYYDMSGNKEHVMCEDCAEDYWAPLDYEQYRVK